MRQPTTAEVRLNEHKAASFGTAGPSILPFWLSARRLRSNFFSAEPPRDGRSRPTTSVSGKCRVVSLRSLATRRACLARGQGQADHSGDEPTQKPLPIKSRRLALVHANLRSFPARRGWVEVL